MLDVLTTTRDRQLAVVELKADEDIHLPLQGLDHWARVAGHHAGGEFQHFGYFPGQELSSARPLLFLIAPTLHIHPASDTVLRYFSPEIDWTLVGIDARWREGVHVIFGKRANTKDLSLRHRDAENLIKGVRKLARFPLLKLTVLTGRDACMPTCSEVPGKQVSPSTLPIDGATSPVVPGDTSCGRRLT